MMDRTLIKAAAHIYAAAYQVHAPHRPLEQSRTYAREAVSDFLQYVEEDYKYRQRR